jgi:pseudouridine-5'-phosphate glycosidase
LIELSPDIAYALQTGQPVVALETSVIANGLPQPVNLEVAMQCQDIIRRTGATAATIGIVAGRPKIGLTDQEIHAFAHRSGIIKTNISNLAWVITRQAWGATTVSATMKLASRVGIKIFATGGIGGVHRDAEKTFDISADLPVLAETPMMIICSGAKSILDLPKTFEYLETAGVPVIGFRTDQFPAFFCRSSGIFVDLSTSSSEEVVEICHTHWNTGNRSAVIVAVPIPPESEIPHAEIEGAISHALNKARQANISGTDLTPFLLSEIEQATAGRSLRANMALLLNNARVAAELANAWSQAVR